MKNTRSGSGRPRPGLGLAVLLLLALFPAACGEDSPTLPPGTIPRVVLVVTIEPSPVIGVQNVLTGAVSGAYVVVIRNLGDVGGQIQFVNSTTFDPETGLQVSASYFDSAALQVFAGTDRIEAEGELRVTQSTNYILPDFRVPADLTVNVQVIGDGSDLVVNQSILTRVVPPEA